MSDIALSGMREALGMVQLAPRQNNWLGAAGFEASKFHSDETARLIDVEVARIINDCHEQAKRLLTEYRKELHQLIAALMKQESLDEKEILDVTALPPAPPASRPPCWFDHSKWLRPENVGTKAGWSRTPTW